MSNDLLGGVRIIESSAFVAAPLCGLTLAQFGADVIRVDMIGGGIDYLLAVAVRDMAEYQALIDRLLAAEIGISRYFTYIVTKTVKDDPAGLARLLLAEAEDPAAVRP